MKWNNGTCLLHEIEQLFFFCRITTVKSKLGALSVSDTGSNMIGNKPEQCMFLMDQPFWADYDYDDKIFSNVLSN